MPFKLRLTAARGKNGLGGARRSFRLNLRACTARKKISLHARE
ncbi:hypothetical protein [uncultured Campylobacter sp.]|nr:hypothetical protein [uncultured Campylobacter sp.]